MTVQSGNLEGLLNKTLSNKSFVHYNASGDTIVGSLLNGTNQLSTVTGSYGQPVTTQSGVTFKITGVNNAANEITITQFDGTTAAGQANYYVNGYSHGSLLISGAPNNSDLFYTLDALLGGMFAISLQDLSTQAGQASNYTASGSYSGVLDIVGATVGTGDTAAAGRQTTSGALGGQTWFSGTKVELDGTTVAAGGSVAVRAYGVTRGTVVESGGKEIVRASGYAAGTTVEAGGTEVLFAGAKASANTVQSGGVLERGGLKLGSGHSFIATTKVDGARVGGVTLAAGATLDLLDAEASAGALVTVEAGGDATGTQLKGGKLNVFAGGATHGTVISSGGSENVFQGGASSNTHILNGGVELVRRGESDGTIVGDGGLEIVRAPGIASATHVLSGGAEVISSGGQGINTHIADGGSVTVLRGATVDGMTLAAGGSLIDQGQVRVYGPAEVAGSISGGGVLNKVGAGNVILDGDNAGFSGQTVISGGRLELASANALGTGKVTFATGIAPDTLQIDAADAPTAGGTFANVITNFASATDAIDLKSVGFATGATAKRTGSTLVLSDGGQTFDFHVAGAVGSSFTATSDGHGGTLISVATAGFAQAAAGFGGRSAAAAVSPVTSGGASNHAPLLAVGAATGRA